MTIFRKLGFMLIVLPCHGQTNASAAGSSVTGIALGEDGTLITGAYITLHQRSPAIFARQSIRRQFGTRSDNQGVFRFDGLSSGSYGVCVQATGTVWLDPCDWGLSVPQVSIGSGQMNITLTVKMTKGAILPIRIDDSGQLLGQHLGKTPGADLLIGISRPGQPFRPTSAISEDGAGRNHQFIVPYGMTVRLVVASSFFKLADGKGNAFNGLSNGTTVTVAAGQQPQPIHVTVTGRQ